MFLATLLWHTLLLFQNFSWLICKKMAKCHKYCADFLLSLHGLLERCWYRSWTFQIVLINLIRVEIKSPIQTIFCTRIEEYYKYLNSIKQLTRHWHWHWHWHWQLNWDLDSLPEGDCDIFVWQFYSNWFLILYSTSQLCSTSYESPATCIT